VKQVVSYNKGLCSFHPLKVDTCIQLTQNRIILLCSCHPVRKVVVVYIRIDRNENKGQNLSKTVVKMTCVPL